MSGEPFGRRECRWLTSARQPPAGEWEPSVAEIVQIERSIGLPGPSEMPVTSRKATAKRRVGGIELPNPVLQRIGCSLALGSDR